MSRTAAGLLVLLTGAVAPAQPVNLIEKATPGDRFRYTVTHEVKGNLLLTREDGQKEVVRVEATGRYAWAERTVAVADGLPAVSMRYYTEAAATTTVAGEKGDRPLSADRRLIVARRQPDGLFCFALAGPLTRDELDLVSEHFNPQCLPGLLPGKVVTVGSTWAIPEAAVRAACQFDAIIKTDLSGKLTGVAEGRATFVIEGTAEGLEAGARVVAAVTATGTFDRAAGRISSLTWKQKDEREAGPVSPASVVEAVVVLRRESLAATDPAAHELADARVERVPPGDVPPALAMLRYADPQGRYSLAYSRDWHVTGQTDAHLVLRLLDGGAFVAQATLSVWRKAAPGGRTPPEEFKRAVARTPGWAVVREVADGDLPAPTGYRLYRLTAEGRLDDVPVVQTFYLLTGPRGDQLAVTVTLPPDRVKALGRRDLDLVNGIEFGQR